MALFGGSKSTSSSSQETVQLGVETEGNVAQYYVPGTLSVIDEFPEPVAAFAQGLLGLTQSVVDQQNSALEMLIGSSQQSAGQTLGAAAEAFDTLGDIAAREKTPLTEWLPFAAVGAAALVALMFYSR